MPQQGKIRSQQTRQLVLSLERSFEQPDVIWREVKQFVDNGVDLSLRGINLRRQLDHLGGFLRKIFFPAVAVLDPNLGLERLLHLGAEHIEIKRPEIFEFSGKLFALGWREVGKDAVVKACPDYEALPGCFAALFTKVDQLNASPF